MNHQSMGDVGYDRSLAGRARGVLLATTAIAPIALGAPALAQDARSGSPAAQTGALEEVVVTARRVDENLQTTPISVTAVSAATLKAMNIVRLQELQLVTPNLMIRESTANGMGSLVYLRGIGSISAQTQNDAPINTYVDGVVISRPTGNGFDLPDVERVEVLRGPQGTLFGRNTTGGAIAIYTKRPTETFGGSLEVNTGRYNEFGANLVVNTGYLGSTKLRSKLTLQRRSINGWVETPGRNKGDWAGFSRDSQAALALSVDPTDKITIDNRTYVQKLQSLPGYQLVFADALALNVINNSPLLGGPPVLLSEKPLDKYYFDSARRQYTPHALSWGNTLNIAYNHSDEFQLKSITGIAGAQHNQTGQLGGSMIIGNVTRVNGITAAEPILFATVNNSDGQNQISQEFQAHGTLGEFDYTAGLYFYTETARENLRSIVPTLLATGQANLIDLSTTSRPHTRSMAGYANVGYKPGALDGQLELTGGLRYTSERKSIRRARTTILSNLAAPIVATPDSAAKSWDNVGWNVSASWRFTPDIMGYVRGSSAFRSGAFQTVPGTPVVNPETAIAVEVGVKTELFDRRLRLNGAFFKTYYDELQVNQRNSLTAVSNIANAGKATYTGVDADAVANIGNGFQVNGALGYVKPEYQRYDFVAGTGVPGVAPGAIVNVASYGRFPLTPRWTFNVGGQYQSEPTSWGIFTARLDYSYQSSFVFQPIGVIPAGIVQATAFPASPNNDSQRSGKSKNLRANLSLSEIPTGTDTLRNVKVQFYADNLTNHRYRLSVVDFANYATASFNRPRSFGVRLGAEF